MNAHRRLVLLALVALTACKKEPEPRPKGDVCADIAHLPNCAALPEGAPEQGFSPAFNCYDVGRQQFNCGLFDVAALTLQKSIALQDDPKSEHALGEALFAQEKWSAAHDAFKKAVVLDPKKRDSWFRLGQSELPVGHFDAAHDAFSKAAELDPKRSDAYQLDAEALTSAGKLDEAIAALKKAEKINDPQNGQAVLQQEVQVLELKQRRSKKAHDQDGMVLASTDMAEALERAAERSPKDAEIQRQLAEALLNTGEMEQAEKALDQAAVLDPKDFVSPRLAAVLEEQRGASAEARASVQASLKVQPKQTVPYLVLGRLDLAAGNLPQAQDDFAQALTFLDGKDAVEILQLAQLAEKLGQGDKAEELYVTLETDPDQSAQLDFWLGEARLAQLNKHAERVKSACLKAKALVANAECPPPRPR